MVMQRATRLLAQLIPRRYPRRTAPISASPPKSLLTTSATCHAQQMPPRPKPPPEDELLETFLKGSGPGGQKIITHVPTGIVVKSQATRSRSQNRKIARDLLAAKLDELRNGEQSRTAIVTEVKRKRKASAAKKSRRKYRALQEEEDISRDGQKDQGIPDDGQSAPIKPQE